MESAWSNGKPAYRCRHGHTTASRRGPGRLKNAYIREDRILPHLPARHVLLTGAGTGAAERRRRRTRSGARCRVCGVRREDQLVSWAEFAVAALGVEHDPAAHAVQHLFMTVFMPAVGIAGPVAPPMRAQDLGTHPGCDLLFAGRRAVMPLDHGISAHRRTSSQPRV